MDFLDPRKKRATAIKLSIGHFLMALIVIFGTYILVYQAYGFGVDRKTGQVIQNGLVFFDSAPNSAKIFLNGEEQKFQTNTRQALNAGDYDVEIRKDGYRPWKRSFELEGGTVERFMYPLLIPNNLQKTEVQSFVSTPALGLQSPDRRWLLLSQPENFNVFSQYDLNNLRNDQPPMTIVAVPADILNMTGPSHVLSMVEWSTDNRHVLLKHEFEGGFEFIMFDREQPAQSLNINQVLSQSPKSISLRDKQFDKLFLYQADNSLWSADLKASTVAPLLEGVLSYKSHGSDVLLYSQVAPGKPDEIRISLREGTRTYGIRDIPKTEVIPLELATYGNHWYVIIGSNGEERTYVYKDPLDSIKSQDSEPPFPISFLKSVGSITNLEFSQNARYIMVNSGQHFSVYDFEKVRQYRYEIEQPIEPTIKPVWMDGNRIIIRTAGQAHIFDYDGINHQTLLANELGLPVFFNRDYDVLYTFSNSTAVPEGMSFYQTFLRLPTDR